MSAPIYPQEEQVDYEVTAEGDYVVLKIPARGWELLFDPVTANALGMAFQAAAKDVIRDSWGNGCDEAVAMYGDGQEVTAGE